MRDVLHQLIDRAGFNSEALAREAHTAIDHWFADHFPDQPEDSTVDSPAPGAPTTVDSADKDVHAE